MFKFSSSHPVAECSLHLVRDDVVGAAVQTAPPSAGCGGVRVGVRVRVCVFVVAVCVVVVVLVCVRAEQQ